MKKFILLRQAMLAHGMNQRELASVAGIGDSSLSARLHGKAEFTAGEMVKIGEALGLQPDEHERGATGSADVYTLLRQSTRQEQEHLLSG